MVNPGIFLGQRRVFMLGEKLAYSEGVKGGYAADALAIIQRRYFKRFPVDLPHDVEPSTEFLEAVDDEEPDPERVEPERDTLNDEEYAAALKEVEGRRRTFVYRKAQIKRWHAYQYMKDHDLDPKDSGLSNPYRVLLHRLTGTSIQCPRMRSAMNIWRRTEALVIEAEVRRLVLEGGISRPMVARLRERVAKEMFLQMNEDEREGWKAQAKEEHEKAIENWTNETQADPSEDPAARQKCIEGLVGFAQPILDLISQATRWKVTMIAGGPEPAHEGRLNVISLHSGTTSGDMKLNFGRAERIRYKKIIVPIYGTFLQKCYTPEECRARTLPTEEGFGGLIAMDVEADGADFDSLGFAGISSMNSTQSSTTNTEQTPIQESNAETNIPPPSPAGSRDPSPPISRVPSPAASRAPSPAVSRAPSPAVSRAPSPAVSRAPSPAISRAPSPGITLSPLSADSRSLAANLIPNLSVPASMAGTKRSFESMAQAEESQVGEPHNPTSKRHRMGHSMVAAALRSILDPMPAARAAIQSTTATETNLPDILSSTSPTVAKVEPAVRSPKWFRSALSMFQADETRLGQRWMELVAVWVDFEVKERYKERKKLSPCCRPPVVEEWIRRARSPTWRPVIVDLAEFERAFNLWWTKLQPEWRVLSTVKTAVGQKDVGGFEDLRKPGLNGLVSLLAALFFWGLRVRDSNVDHIRWSAAVEESLAAIREIIQHYHT